MYATRIGATPSKSLWPALRPAHTPVAALAFALLVAGVTACDERSPTGSDSPPSADVVGAAASAGGVADGAVASSSGGSLRLPIDQSAASSGVLFGLTQTGTGAAGAFKITNAQSFAAALDVATQGRGDGASFKILNAASGAPAVRAEHGGSGSAGAFLITNRNNQAAALVASTPGQGQAIEAIASTSDATLSAFNSGTGFVAHLDARGPAKGLLIETQGGAGLQVVGGSKNAVVSTATGARALYTEESSEVWFTDYGFGRLTNGRARILFDPTFAQTINPDEPYHVFLQSYGDAELIVRDRTALGFVVEQRAGRESNAEFSYRIVGKRRGFEATRLERAPWADGVATGFAGGSR